MKVAMITAVLSDAAGGLAGAIPPISNRMQTLDAHVVGIRDPKEPSAAEHWGRSVHAVSSWPSFGFHFAPQFGNTLKRVSPHLMDVNGLWTWPNYASFKFSLQNQIPVIVSPHGMLDPWALSNSAKKKMAIRRVFQNRQLKLATCLRATAEMEADHFRKLGLLNPIAIVPNGVEVPQLIQRSKATVSRRRLLFLSRIHPKKGLPLLIDAWKVIAHERSDWELLIVGPDELGHLSEIQKRARGVERVFWKGEIKGEEKNALYQSADLFVLPTHSENFGLVVAEALANGVPVVTTKHAPWQALEENDCGWWIDLSLGALIETLRYSTSLSPAALNAMGDKGRAFVRREFDWDSIAEKMTDVYLWVANRAERPETVFG